MEIWYNIRYKTSKKITRYCILVNNIKPTTLISCKESPDSEFDIRPETGYLAKYPAIYTISRYRISRYWIVFGLLPDIRSIFLILRMSKICRRPWQPLWASSGYWVIFGQAKSICYNGYVVNNNTTVSFIELAVNRISNWPDIRPW